MRKKRIWKLSLCLMIIILFGAFTMPSFADIETPEILDDVEIGDGEDGLDSIEISVDDIELTENQKTEYDKLCTEMANAIGSSSNYEKAIQDFTNSNDCSSQEAVLNCIIAKVLAANDNDFGLPEVSLDNSITKEFERTFTINKTTKVTVSPTQIIVTKNKLTKKRVKSKKKTWAQNYSENQTYYSWKGLKAYTIGMKCSFYYNGKKAWYKSGFDGSYKPYGDGIQYQMTEWKEKHKQSGKKHIAEVSGNLQHGIESNESAVIFENQYVKHLVTCSKNGKVTCKYSL